MVDLRLQRNVHQLMSLDLFHPSVANWFAKQFPAPTEPQARAWCSIQARQHTLVAAPTGSGKTLAAFLATIDHLVRQGVQGSLEDTAQVVYVSPLKALSNDIQRNLQQPLAGIQAELSQGGCGEVPIRTLVRTGDTLPSERTAMARRPPHIVVTTPESLYILLTSVSGRAMLRTVHTVIVDEIHALLADKRGSHLALSLERLEALAGRSLVRVGLSATQRPIEEVARFLVGGDGPVSHDPPCTIIDAGHARDLELAIEVPSSPLEAVMSGEVWNEVYDRLAALVAEHRTTLVFVNTRRLAERVAHHLGERLGEQNVSSHHGSLSREKRLAAEQRLKAGELRALVATASLELGIDIGAVDLVCQLGSTRSIATLLQRVGRSGHAVAGFPKGRLFPLTRDELVECAALLDAVRRRELDHVIIPRHSLDVLAQQIVAATACEEWTEDALYDLVRRAYPYRDLGRGDFDAVVRMLAEGFTTRRGRRAAFVHRDAVNGRLRGRRGARLAAITSGGAIPDNADYDVLMEPTATFVGTVNEDFAVESLPGDIFQLGNTSWRIMRIEPGKVRVEDAHGQPPTIPFWLGEAPTRTEELSAAVSRLRLEVSQRLTPSANGKASPPADPSLESAVAQQRSNAGALDWLVEEAGVGRAAAEQIVDYLVATRAALGVMPTQQTLVLERFFDETGGMQLVIHSPFGSRLNRAWGLALRKTFCQRFNFELQAAASEDAIVLSLGPTHSFPLDEVYRYLRRAAVRDLLVQALLDAPMFASRWRWNTTRALAVLRWRGGRKVPPTLQRMNADDLLAVVFPDQLACAENLQGRREIPDHPLVNQTVRDCLEEAMDIHALEALLEAIDKGQKQLVALDLTEPSPLAHEILNARPYAFLDDAPLEERRTQAVFNRRWLDPETAADLGRLDPDAIGRVRDEAWPQFETADELHEALVLLGFLTDEEISRGADGDDGSKALIGQLIADRRAALLRSGQNGRCLWIAAERLPELRAVFPDAPLEPPIAAPREAAERRYSEDEALVELLRGRLEAVGPTTAAALAASAGLPTTPVEAALVRLEVEGFVLRGRFTPAADQTEWCARRLLSRIHRYTLNRLRREIEPVSAADFLRFLLAWQRLEPDQRAEGPESLARIVQQLEGFEAASAAWESEILPARLVTYDPFWLDALCLSGRLVWARLTPPKGESPRGPGVLRSTPIALLDRGNLPAWNALFPRPTADGAHLSSAAQAVYDRLAQRGACFLEELSQLTGLLRSEVDRALGELVARSLVTCDGFNGLRALLSPARPSNGRWRRRASGVFGVERSGRWVILGNDLGTEPGSESVEMIARVLLQRYGVVFRRLLERESWLPPWRALLNVYRTLEARGEIRGGRFVDGFAGEQFALPEAVATLRSARREAPSGSLVSVSAADPLNLVGIVTPGSRVAPARGNRILYRDGVPMAIREAGQVRHLVEPEPGTEWQIKRVLLRGSGPAEPRAAVSRPA
jgi:ATP-dependent helicase Lhr and Lhr-like helicase